MRTAVIISGHLRTFQICYPNQKWMVYRHYEPDIEFFVCVYDDLQARLKHKLWNDYKVSARYLKEPLDLPKIPIEECYGTAYPGSSTNYQIMSQLWINNQAWKFFIETAGANEFDTIIRMRPDLYFHRFIPPPTPTRNECYTPWWGKFGGINDRVAIMDERAASRYFNEYGMVPELLKIGCPFHPETMLGQTMKDVTVRNTLMTEFSTIRLNGEQRKPEVVFADVLEFLQCQK